jgi:hypothetical protein
MIFRPAGARLVPLTNVTVSLDRKDIRLKSAYCLCLRLPMCGVRRDCEGCVFGPTVGAFEKAIRPLKRVFSYCGAQQRQAIQIYTRRRSVFD